MLLQASLSGKSGRVNEAVSCEDVTWNTRAQTRQQEKPDFKRSTSQRCDLGKATAPEALCVMGRGHRAAP